MDSRLEKAIVEAFDANGPLCRQIEGFKRRDSQLQFAQAVGQAIQTQGVAVVEAGTGTGKTFAYLVPAILSRSKTIVSTASKTLQDQLFEKDVGRICSALAVDADVAVLKGRGNYICKERLEKLVDRGLLPEADSYKRLKKIIDFARRDATGDKNDIPGIPEKDPLWPWVTSTKDNCLGKSKCPHYDDCFVNRARARAHEADIVIVNHHLFMADLSLKDDTMAELLPDADLVILDEAHKLPDIGIDYFSDIFSLWELQDFSEEGRLIGKAHAAGVVRWDDVFLDVKKAALNLHQIIHRGLGVEIDTEIEINSIEGFAQSIKEPFEKLIESVFTIAKTFKSLEGSNEECDLFSDRAADLLKRMQDWQVTLTNPSAVKTVGGIPSVLWLRLTEQNVFFSNTPLSLAQPFAKAREKMHNAWILTSATISTRKDDGSADFSYFLGELICNMNQHSQGRYGYIFSQYIKKEASIDVILADDGITVYGSYVRTGKYLDRIGNNDAEALKLANEGYSTKDLPESENRGFGISTSKEMLVDGLKGSFFMLSGGAFHWHDLNGSAFIKLPDSIYWNGTIILMRIPVNVPTGFNYLKYVAR